jgi:hypothetical protein
MNQRMNLKNQIFGQLTVIKFAGNTPQGKATWLCRCTCGQEKVVSARYLRGGNTKSCGCFRVKRCQMLGSNTATHGLSKTPTYESWVQMISRCTNPQNPGFQYYGRKGVAVDPRWRDFSVFLQDLGIRPPRTSLGRFLDHGSYSPNNVKWMTKKEQSIQQNLKRLIQKESYVAATQMQTQLRG